MASKKLRIAVWHNLPSGGAKRALWDSVSGLLAQGHHVESWCPDTADQKYLPLEKICREHVVPLKPSPLKPALKFFRWAAECRQMKDLIAALRVHNAACAAEINAGKFDVLFANTCLYLAAPGIGRLVDLPSAVHIAEPYRRNYETIEDSPWAGPAAKAGEVTPGLARLSVSSLKLQYRRLQMREELDNARAYDRILANSFYSRESILRAYGLESAVCYLGIDTDFFRPTGEPPDKYLMGFGAVVSIKGIGRAIEALGCVRPELRPKLLWVGNTANESYVAEMTRRAKELGVEFEIRVMVDDTELISLLSRAAAVIYTSLLEPFGLAPLEANACGTPVIAIAEGGVRETIVDGENGLLLPDANPRAMAAVIEKYFQDPKLADGLRAKCRDAILARWKKAAGAERLEKALLATIETAAAKKT